MSSVEQRGMVLLGTARKAGRRKRGSQWVPVFQPWFSDQLTDSSRQALLNQSHLHSLSKPDRVRLVHAQIHAHKSSSELELKEALAELNSACITEEELDAAISAEVLRKKGIIGMTITGASIHAELVREVKPDVVLVEEAAEVLEPQILAVLGPWVKHLIMIGDHLQLPPPVETYPLKREHHFDTSMMERLILNRLPHISLLRQSRMLPSLSALLKPIYPQLQDNLAVVSAHAAPACVRSEVFLWNCPHPEQEGERSRTNAAERERVVQLCLFFIAQGFCPNKITALSSYQGQAADIRKTLKQILPGYLSEIGLKKELQPVYASVDAAIIDRGNRVDIQESKESKGKGRGKERAYTTDGRRIQPGQYIVTESPPGKKIIGEFQKPEGKDKMVDVKLEPAALQPDEMVEVHTIDRYQGDENDIVIISLVRSNAQNKLGFLGTDDGRNRMCVAQSRARKGLYFIANKECLSSAPHWNTLIKLLNDRNCIGDSFPQRCPRHLHAVRDAREASDLCTGKTAVCGLLCGQAYGCGVPGHVCQRPCHPASEHDASQCPYEITKVFNCKEFPQHTFPRLRCGRRTDLEPCPFEE
eukprot:TRINITY_DN64996_c0_g1_i1.p1 TRINITY_DN64996_c0_g1~~TRINITY_DN64996_c0_g1_i1.p1  ORF type:complete len:651 (-),score=96.34 TRINITY_DN64996_c0_g1_i1:22-1782(-)